MLTFAQKRPSAPGHAPREAARSSAPPQTDAVFAPAKDPAADTDTATQAIGSQGHALPKDVLRYFEPRFGHDFSKVRVHDGATAAHGAQAIQARAYTLGHDIVFGSGEYSPSTREGRRLIAHELAHVVQQEGGLAASRAPSAKIRRQPVPTTPPTKPTKHKVTLDEVVQTMTGLGGPYTDTAAWEKTMVPTTFLGHSISGGGTGVNGVRQEFQSMLARAETKVKDEYKKSGNTPPANYGIKFIGGYRREISPHGSGVAIDIDGGDNPYIMHEDESNAAITDPSKLTNLSKEVGPVYTHIAEFILNSPIDGEQSIIPKLMMTAQTLPKGQKVSRRDLVGQYYDRLSQESEAMKKYFTLMQNDAALQAFLAGDWVKLHPGQTAPTLNATKTQMWNDYALLGGAIPKGGPPGITGFTQPRAAGRPFHPSSGGQKDPAAGFLTLPREVVLGLGQVVPRWGALDFGAQSGDIMHFDDAEGIGKPFRDTGKDLGAKADSDFKADMAAYKAALKAQQQGSGSGSGSGSGAPTQQQQGSGSAAPPPQRKAILGEINDPLEREADAVADRVMQMEPSAPEHTHAPQPLSPSHAGTVRRKIRVEDVGKEMVGLKFHLRKAFTAGAVTVPAGELVTVKSWDNTSNTVEVTSASVPTPYLVPKYLLNPERTPAAGIAPYGVGLGSVEESAEKGAADLEAFKKTESTYKTEKSKKFFASEVKDKETLQASREKTLNIRLIQSTMLNRFDTSIKNWVDFYNTKFGFKGKDALDPNLIKAMMYQESQMGTFGDFMSDPPTNIILNRFNVLQAVDSWPLEQLNVIPEMMPGLISKYHLENIQRDLLLVETEFDTLREKQKKGTIKPDEVTRLSDLNTQSQHDWQPWFLNYTAPGETKGFKDAAEEFLKTVSGGKTQWQDYDFWIRVGIRAVFEKRKGVKTWEEAARAYNGSGPDARKYRNAVVKRSADAVKSEKDSKEFIPGNL